MWDQLSDLICEKIVPHWQEISHLPKKSATGTREYCYPTCEANPFPSLSQHGTHKNWAIGPGRLKDLFSAAPTFGF